MVSSVLHVQEEAFDWVRAWPGSDVGQGAWPRFSFPPTYSSTMYRALRLLARSRRLLRVPSAGAAVSGEAATLRSCASNVARMVSGHLGLGLPAVTFMSACPGCPRGPHLGSAPAGTLRTPPPAGGVGAAGYAVGRAPAVEPGCQSRPAQCLSL